MSKTSLNNALSGVKNDVDVIEHPNFYLFKNKKNSSSWVVIGAHGISDMKHEITLSAKTKLLFTTRKGEEAPGTDCSSYMLKAVHEPKETFVANGMSKPFDHWLEKYSYKKGSYAQNPDYEYDYIQYVSDMFQNKSQLKFDLVVVRRSKAYNGGVWLSEVISWLEKNYKYENIVAGFCYSVDQSNVQKNPSMLGELQKKISGRLKKENK